MNFLALIFATSASAATVPPSPFRRDPRRRAMSCMLDDPDYTVSDNEILIRAVTDSSISGDHAPQWAKSLRTSLSSVLFKNPVTPGLEHPEETTVNETLEDHGEDAAAFFASIVLSKEPWRGDLLRLLARAPDNLTRPWGVALAGAALSDPDIDVREAAVSALEAWGGSEARRMLESHNDPQPWLSEFAHRVARELS